MNTDPEYDMTEFLFDMNIVLYHWFHEQEPEKQEAIKAMLSDCPCIRELFTLYPYQIASGKK